MQPNDSQQPGQYPNDYLDSIAVKQPVKTVNPFLLWGIIGGALLLVIFMVFAIAGATKPATNGLVQYGVQMTELKRIADDAQKEIKSGELRSANGSFSIILTNANRDLAAPLEQQGVKLDNKKDSTTAATLADAAKLEGRLEDARLNGVYDRTYAREMTYYIKTIRSEMTILHSKSRSTSFKKVLESTDTSLKPLQEQFESFNNG